MAAHGNIFYKQIRSGGVQVKTAAYTLVDADAWTNIVYNGSVAATFTLPNPPTNSLWKVTIANIVSSTLTISRNGLTIDGVASDLTLSQYQGVVIYTDGTNYFTERGMTSGGGSSITLKTNGTNNGSQTVLNLVAGTNMTITDNGTGSVTFASTGGGGGADVAKWDDPPASPDTHDDEFTGTSLNAKWTVSANTATNVSYSTNVPSCVSIDLGATSQEYQIYQGFAPAADFSVQCCLGAGLNTNFGFAEIILADNVPASYSNAWALALQYNSGAIRVTAHKRVSGTWTFNVFNATNLPLTQGHIYFHIQRKSGVWSSYYSMNEATWFALSTNMAYAPTVNDVILDFASDGGSSIVATVDWIRFNRYFIT